MKYGTTIRVPADLVERIDEFVVKEFYSSRAEFVTASIRYALIFYADLRKIAIEGNTTILGVVTSRTMPQPINDGISGLDMLLNRKPEQNPATKEKSSEDDIAKYYKSVTRTFLHIFNSFGGAKIQISFSYPNGLRDRARVLHKTAYGFSKKMDFIKVSIVCLLIKTFETNMLYDELDRYFSEMKIYHTETVRDLLLGFLSSKDLETTIDSAVASVFEDSEYLPMDEEDYPRDGDR